MSRCETASPSEPIHNPICRTLSITYTILVWKRVPIMEVGDECIQMTAAKLAANRNNAKLSTGPRNTQSTRFNGVQHGLTSKQTVIPGESQEAYDNFYSGLIAELR